MNTLRPFALGTLLCLAGLTGCDTADTEPGAAHREAKADGCTLTQGYWKNHTKYAKGKKKSPWSEQAGAYGQFGWDEDSPALSANVDGYTCPDRGSYLDVMQTPVAGDAWLILMHQYVAAKLNLTSGASDGDAWGLVIDARELLADCEIDADEHDDAIALAEELDAFNNGEWGPGHCDADE